MSSKLDGAENKMLSDIKLNEYSSEHIYYEIEMFYLASIYDLSSGSQFERNTLTEAFCIHLRNLITFLYPTSNQKPGDIYAFHYFEKISDNIPELSQSLEEARKRCHKEVGHLTTDRITGVCDPKKSWDRFALAREIFSLLNIFSSGASKDRLNSKVSDFLSAIVI